MAAGAAGSVMTMRSEGLLAGKVSMRVDFA
jgi:hypothetical protein